MAEQSALGISMPGQGTSIPCGQNAVWADVAPLLEAACQDLQDGELINGDNFNLFAAMSALEIMDPKMDSGMVCNYCSLDEAIENGAAPVPISFDKTTDVRCTIDIMDHLLACEATWHKGHSLAQTVFSCLYLLRPDRTSGYALLHSYCKVILETCKAVLSVVSYARTHEEEDIFTMTYGLPLSGDRDEKSLSMLNVVEETISRQLRACKTSSSKRRILEDIEPLQSNLDLEEGYCKALLCRLRFRKHFYHALTCMRRPQGRGLELARKHIASCISELECIRKSAEFLRCSARRTSTDCINATTTASGCQPIGFDASINSRLSAPMPPRSIKIFGWEKAVDYFVKLLHDLDIVCSCSLDPSLECVLNFVVKFQKYQPDLVSRAHLQVLLVQDGKLYGRDPIFAVITRAAGLPEVTNNHEIQKNESIVKLGQLLINLLKILCTNAAWQRRKLGRMLQDWRVIHAQIEMAFGNDFREASSTTNNENLCIKIIQQILIWVEEQTYWTASRFLILGFELELYSLHEYCMVYWYIYVVLIKLAEKAHMKLSISNATAKRKTKKKKDSPKDVTRDYQIPPAVLFLQCQIYLAEGLSMMLAALRNEHRILPLPGPFNTEHEIFIQHFELLQRACLPDNISYLSFKESTVHASFSTLVMYNYFKEAQRIAKEVKSSFCNDPDKMAELRRVEQVAEHNSIALNVICRVGTLDPSLKISFEFSHHPYFATAIVKRC
ncbi:N-alpha-acetyltransferase 35 NatC auxiliary subunit [Quillaja saponaria]|uniref:N-alpha-acetyltransferase 35 NatC auxiliary subunit n=1 Tax=Quillaja saponaria TaxID=32244 RepID=A0AAD7LEM4_QUISA|nr:N-alpha-acetyltransferase 35 NatC auxiliary subunit [Quillaja saponaria]KAJ7956749.1 N-alpha-acetyltransferase 35 NatC auxiliary subunit [Quillaja saponaria]